MTEWIQLQLQPPPLPFSTNPIYVIACIILVIAALIVALYNYRKAREEKHTAATQRETASLELQRVQTQFDELRNQPAIEQIERLFMRSHCPSARLDCAVLCLEHTHTIQQATLQLEALSAEIKKVDPDWPLSPAWVAYIESILAHLIDGPAISLLTFPGKPENLETKVIECYTLLAPSLTRPHNFPGRDAVIRKYEHQRDQAIQHCQRWLDLKEREHLRKETTRDFLPALLNVSAGDKSLLKLLKDIVSIGEKNPMSPIEEDTVVCAIRGMKWLTEVPSNERLDLIDRALKIASKSWRPAFREPCKEIVRHVLQEGCFQPSELGNLQDTVRGIIKSHEKELIENPQREDDYSFLTGLMVDLHNHLDPNNPRQHRPKIRHIIQGQVPVKLTPDVNPNTAIQAQLINFSVGKGIWIAGAFATNRDRLQEFSPNTWVHGTVVIEGPTGLVILPRAEIKSHDEDTTGKPHRDSYGYRIKFQSLTVTEKQQLTSLAAEFPSTR